MPSPNSPVQFIVEIRLPFCPPFYLRKMPQDHPDEYALDTHSSYATRFSAIDATYAVMRANSIWNTSYEPRLIPCS